MIVELLEEADQELTEATLWYESKEPGLGIRFRDEVAHVIERIATDPLLLYGLVTWVTGVRGHR